MDYVEILLKIKKIREEKRAKELEEERRIRDAWNRPYLRRHPAYPHISGCMGIPESGETEYTIVGDFETILKSFYR